MSTTINLQFAAVPVLPASVTMLTLINAATGITPPGVTVPSAFSGSGTNWAFAPINDQQLPIVYDYTYTITMPSGQFFTLRNSISGGGTNSASSIGTTVTTVILPQFHLTCIQNMAPTFVFNTPYNLSGKTVRFVAFTEDAFTPVTQFVRGTDTSGIVIFGPNNSQVSVSLTGTNTANFESLSFNLLNITDNIALAEGIVEIQPSNLD